MKITELVARIGTNPRWIAFNAHCWFAFALVIVLSSACGYAPLWAVLALGATILAMSAVLVVVAEMVRSRGLKDRRHRMVGA